MKWFLLTLLAVISIPARSMDAPALALDGKIMLGNVSGRIDHLAVDLKRQRLFVAELGNNTVGMIDVKERKVLGRISGFKEPQGVAYHASTDTLYVANGGDGSLRLFSGPDLTPRAQLDLRDDADNVRIDAKGERVVVGYGKGALAIIDPAKSARIGDIKLDAHPEGFQLDRNGRNAYINLPGSRKVVFVDLQAGKVTRSLPMNEARANFPMAVDHDRERILTVFRTPPKLMVINARDGSVVTSTDVCGDSDDVFVDAKRRRAYVSCGEGFVDVFDMQDSGLVRSGHIKTVSGARTSLWVQDLDRLFVAARASGTEPAAIWVFRPE